MEGWPGADTAVSRQDAGGLRHVMFSYRDRASYRAEILRFAQAGLAAGEPVLIALPGNEAQDLAGRLGQPGSHGAALISCDMSGLGRNPARVIPALRAFADRHTGRRVSLIQEPAWPGRSPAETREAIRSDALLNLALAGLAANALCLFDEASLPPSVMTGAELTHPEYLPGRQRSAAARAGRTAAPWEFPQGFDDPLPPPPASAEILPYRSDLAPVRRLVERHARRAGLGALRTADLVLAVSEVTANTLDHTASDGKLAVWHDDQEILCQADDEGWITDPLAGRVRRPADSRGHGLLVVNQLCDLVEVRTSPAGTTVRMHCAAPVCS